MVSNLQEEIKGLLENKKEHLLGILDFTKLQKTAIDQSDETKLLGFIDEKQKLIDKINTIDNSFIKKLEQLKLELGIKSLEEINANANPEYKAIKIETEGIYKILQEIMELEKENNSRIKKEYDDVKEKIKEINSSKKMTSAYEKMGKSYHGGAFIDKKK
jgi:hypothetical protein